MQKHNMRCQWMPKIEHQPIILVFVVKTTSCAVVDVDNAVHTSLDKKVD